MGSQRLTVAAEWRAGPYKKPPRPQLRLQLGGHYMKPPRKRCDPPEPELLYLLLDFLLLLLIHWRRRGVSRSKGVMVVLLEMLHHAGSRGQSVLVGAPSSTRPSRLFFIYNFFFQIISLIISTTQMFTAGIVEISSLDNDNGRVQNS